VLHIPSLARRQPLSPFLYVPLRCPADPGSTRGQLIPVYITSPGRCTLKVLICLGGSRSSVSPSSRAVVFLFGGSQSPENRLYRDHLTRPIGELPLSATSDRLARARARYGFELRRFYGISRERSLAPASSSASSRVYYFITE